jgi:Low psii accumulation1 / Rep27
MLVSSCQSFVMVPRVTSICPTHGMDTRVSPCTFQLLAKKKDAIDPSVQAKLVTESIAPWRSLRVYLYTALGAGAALGGFITLSGVLATLSGARNDLDLNESLKNLAIDFGAVAIFAVFWKIDNDKSVELNEKVEQQLDRKKERSKVVKAMREREQKLQDLSLNIQVSVDGTLKEAKVAQLQSGAKQHLIIVAGPKKACRDALVGATLLKNDFSLSNVLVVPYDTAVGVEGATPAGFGTRPAYETQPFVARPVGDGWVEYIDAEMEDAIKQSGESCKEQGIAIVVQNTGQVIRRGVGTVPWRQMVDELIGKESEDLPLI